MIRHRTFTTILLTVSGALGASVPAASSLADTQGVNQPEPEIPPGIAHGNSPGDPTMHDGSGGEPPAVPLAAGLLGWDRFGLLPRDPWQALIEDIPTGPLPPVATRGIFDDLPQYLDYHGTAAPPDAAMGVPAPGALVLIGLGAAAALSGRRDRRKRTGAERGVVRCPGS